MPDLTVLEVPQWQGSGAVTARRLSKGAAELARHIPAARRRVVPIEPYAGPTRDGVRNADVLERQLRAMRKVLKEEANPDGMTVTIGGDCAVDLAPVETALARHGERLALVWFDAHADLNTPRSSPSGAFHGMVLRSLIGDGPGRLRPAQCIAPQRVVLAGARSLDPGEWGFVEHHGVCRLEVGQLAEPTALLTAVRNTGADAVYVHIDLDVLDPQHFAAVGTPEPGGLPPDGLIAAFRALSDSFALAGVAITEYEPSDSASDSAREGAVLQRLAEGLFGATGH